MSILIKGMEMPDSCFHCKISEVCQYYKAEHYANKRHEDCPLEEVPSAQPEHDWNEIMVICDNCGHAINVKRENCKVSAQPEWNNHTVACMLAELFDDDCACNYNGIDEWLPRKCELLDACPNPVGVACWEQYLKHRAERRTDE